MCQLGAHKLAGDTVRKCRSVRQKGKVVLSLSRLGYSLSKL